MNIIDMFDWDMDWPGYDPDYVGEKRLPKPDDDEEEGGGSTPRGYPTRGRKPGYHHPDNHKPKNEGDWGP